jgi:hypothetical protein
MLDKEHKHYPSWVICIDGEPLEECDGSITLYQEGDDDDIKERFMAIVYLSEDSSRVTIKKFDLVPHTFASSISADKFRKLAQETKRKG